MAGELGQQTVELGAVVRRAAEESYLALRELVEKSQAEAEGKGLGAGANGGWQRSDTEKKIDLLKFITRTRQRMLRLHVLAKWCQQVPPNFSLCSLFLFACSFPCHNSIVVTSEEFNLTGVSASNLIPMSYFWACCFSCIVLPIKFSAIKEDLDTSCKKRRSIFIVVGFLQCSGPEDQ